MILITTVSISNSASCQSRGQVRDNPERIRASSPSLRTEISAMARSPPISCIKKMHDEWTAEKPGRGNRPPLQSSELGLSFFFFFGRIFPVLVSYTVAPFSIDRVVLYSVPWVSQRP